MILESWSIALLTCSTVTLFLSIIASITGWRVLRSWDMESDSELQIRLEEATWLSAALVQFALIIAMLSVLMLVFAADHYATILKGAMCATGALTANGYGIPALACKLVIVFCCTIWLVLHRLDVSSEHYPLVRVKYILLVFLLPLFAADTTLLFLYLFNLEPEIITSCCGVIFSAQEIDGYNLLGILPVPVVMSIYGVIISLIVTCNLLMLYARRSDLFSTSLVTISSVAWGCFYISSLVVVTVVVSPFVYGMPHHRCPFDLLQAPYSAIGYPLYIFLHGAVLSGISASVAWLVRKQPGLEKTARRVYDVAGRLSMVCLVVFLIIAAWEPVLYLVLGGQR